MNPNLYGEIRRSVRSCPDHIALVGRTGWRTYRQLDRNVQRRAAFLAQSGVRSGHRVGLGLDTALARLEILLAIMQLGACTVSSGSITSAAGQGELQRRLRLDWVIGEEEDHGSVGDAWLSMPGDLAGINVARQEIAQVGEDQPALFYPFSDHSDPANGLGLTHGQLRARLRLLPSSPRPGCRLAPAGFGGLFEIVCCLGALAAGATVVLGSGLKPGHLCNILGVSDLRLSAPWARHFCSQTAPSADRFPSLQDVSLYAPGCEPGLLFELYRRGLPRCGFVYEWPETGPVAVAGPVLLEQQPLSAGHVLPGIEVEIVDPEHRPQPSGTTGLVRVRSPGMAGADHAPGLKPGPCFHDGWFYPGQLGRLENGGLLFVAGREEQLFFADGQWVNPALVEQVLMTHPRVIEAVAFQSPAKAGAGSSLVAAVTTRADCMTELRAYARARLGCWAPASVIQLAEFPPGADRAATRRLLANLVA